MTCSRLVYVYLITFSWLVHDLCMTCQWLVQDFSMTCSWLVYDTFLRAFCDSSDNFPRFLSWHFEPWNSSYFLLAGIVQLLLEHVFQKNLLISPYISLVIILSPNPIVPPSQSYQILILILVTWSRRSADSQCWCVGYLVNIITHNRIIYNCIP